MAEEWRCEEEELEQEYYRKLRRYVDGISKAELR